MNTTLAKEIVRRRTAYRVGRTLVDILLILELGGLIVAAVPFTVNHFPQPGQEIEITPILIGVSIAVVWFMVAIVQRELMHAVFDIADRALTGCKLDLVEEVPSLH